MLSAARLILRTFCEREKRGKKEENNRSYYVPILLPAKMRLDIPGVGCHLSIACTSMIGGNFTLERNGCMGSITNNKNAQKTKDKRRKTKTKMV